MRRLKHTLFILSGFLFMGNTLLFGVPTFIQPQPQIIASREMSLNDRYAVPFVNEVMKDNILLTIAYMRGIVSSPAQVNWNQVTKPFSYSFELKPGDTYAFQRDSLPQFQDSVKVTTNLHFASQEGFKSDGYLYGDGVCHLASLFYWAAKGARLTAVAPTNHNFAVIPEIPREYGVAIYSQPGTPEANARQNLYVQNNDSTPIRFDISYDGNELKVNVVKLPATVPMLTQEII